MNKSIFLFILAGLLIAFTLILWDSPSVILGESDPNNALPQQAVPDAIATNAYSQYFSKTGELSYSFKAKTLKYFSADDTLGAESVKPKKVIPDQPSSGLTQSNQNLLTVFTDIENPHITFYGNDTLWNIKADIGILRENGQVMLFKDNVVLWQEDFNKALRTQATQDTQKLAQRDNGNSQENDQESNQENKLNLSADASLLPMIQKGNEPINPRSIKLTTDELIIKPDERIAYTDKTVKIASAFGQIESNGMTANLTLRTIKLLNSVKGKYDKPFENGHLDEKK